AGLEHRRQESVPQTTQKHHVFSVFLAVFQRIRHPLRSTHPPYGGSRRQSYWIEGSHKSPGQSARGVYFGSHNKRIFQEQNLCQQAISSTADCRFPPKPMISQKTES